MSYVVAGYSIVLGILFLYGLDLLWRRRRLTRAVERIRSARAGGPAGPDGTHPVDPADPVTVPR